MQLQCNGDNWEDKSQHSEWPLNKEWRGQHSQSLFFLNAFTNLPIGIFYCISQLPIASNAFPWPSASIGCQQISQTATQQEVQFVIAHSCSHTHTHTHTHTHAHSCSHTALATVILFWCLYQSTVWMDLSSYSCWIESSWQQRSWSSPLATASPFNWHWNEHGNRSARCGNGSLSNNKIQFCCISHLQAGLNICHHFGTTLKSFTYTSFDSVH